MDKRIVLCNSVLNHYNLYFISICTYKNVSFTKDIFTFLGDRPVLGVCLVALSLTALVFFTRHLRNHVI